VGPTYKQINMVYDRDMYRSLCSTCGAIVACVSAGRFDKNEFYRVRAVLSRNAKRRKPADHWEFGYAAFRSIKTFLLGVEIEFWIAILWWLIMAEIAIHLL